jgi:putative ABC transport system substrate-binding protein
MRRIGVLMVIAENDPEAQPRIAAFLAGLQAFGWKDGRNVRIDYRWAADDTGRMRAYATELIDTAPDVIFVSSTPALAALGTRTIPIIFVGVPDPISSGFRGEPGAAGRQRHGCLLRYRGAWGKTTWAVA